jgi:hypothetical protein
MTELPTITDADALLAMLRENPTRRAVEYRHCADDEERPPFESIGPTALTADASLP